MRRLALILTSVMALLAVTAFQYVTPGQAGQPVTATVSGAGEVKQMQYVQYRPPGLFDRGSCQLSCMDRYGGPSSWKGDRTDRSQGGSNIDYLRCSTQCDNRNWEEQDRSRKLY